MTEAQGSGRVAGRPRPGSPIAADTGRTLGWRLAALILPALVVCQFGLIAALIAEPRLVPAPLVWIGEHVLSPWFTQDWRLFAPTPDVHDYQVLARGGYRAEGRLTSTPWISLMDPLVAEVQANRLAPATVRLEIVHKAALFSLRTAGPLAMTPLGREALAEQWSSVERQPASVVLLVRLASAALVEGYPDRPFETVQVMVTARPVVSLGGASPDDSELAFVLAPVPFQQVGR